MMNSHRRLLWTVSIVTLLVTAKQTLAFTAPCPSLTRQRVGHTDGQTNNHSPLRPPRDALPPRIPSCSNRTMRRNLGLSSLFLNKPARNVLLLTVSTFLVTAFLFRRRSSLLWPGVKADASFAEPLPPDTLGCPFFGSNILAGSKQEGPETFYRKASARLGHPRVWMYYFMGKPVASISGASLVKDTLSKEFIMLGPLSQESNNTTMKQQVAIFGTNNVMFERDKEKHSFLRRLVGSGMSPAALRQALPTIQQTANDSINQLLNQSGPIRMEDACLDYLVYHGDCTKAVVGFGRHDATRTSRVSTENVHMAVRHVLCCIQYGTACVHY